MSDTDKSIIDALRGEQPPGKDKSRGKFKNRGIDIYDEQKTFRASTRGPDDSNAGSRSIIDELAQEHDADQQPEPVAEPRSNGVAPILRVDDLGVSFGRGKGARAQAVDGVRLSLFERQTLAVVGESGCGKSVTALSSLQLIPTPPGAYDRGSIRYQSSDELGVGEVDLLALDQKTMRRVRGSEIAMIFQEPMTSLNPVYTIGDQLTEAIRLHQSVGTREAKEIAVRALTDVGIDKPERRLRAYPHEFSGGMRQRVMIAMALACEPRVLLADEPTTALDVTVQAQILDLIDGLKRDRGLAVMLITHDLGVVANHADVVCVMYAGRVVEYARSDALFANPLHPYTRGLLACTPRLRDRRPTLTTIRDVIEDQSEFDRLGPDLRPWWAFHEPPPDLSPGRPGDDSVLIEVEPEHWVGVWRSGRAAGAERTTPLVAPKT